MKENDKKKRKGKINYSYEEEREVYSLQHRFVEKINKEVDVQFWKSSNSGLSIKTDLKDYLVFNPELYYLIGLSDIPVIHRETKKETKIPGRIFLESYYEGYEKGEQYFDENFKISPNVIYGGNHYMYIADLAENYFDKLIMYKGKKVPNYRGWKSRSSGIPMIWSKESFHQIGYFSGLVSRVENLQKKYPKIFQDFKGEQDEDTKRSNEFNVPTFIPSISTKHHVLSFILECYAIGQSLPIGQKNKLEQIGNSLIGPGKGNTFYKKFNEMINHDLNSENILLELAGEGWREIVISLSKYPEQLKKYLISKKL